MTGFPIVAKYHVVEGVLETSKLYPGTTHEVIVTVPDSYDGTEPAALYLGLDGILCDAPNVIDSLMSAGKLPVTIGVFLQPGIVRNQEGTVVRYNRSNEFDAIDNRFVTFLEQELLPYVESLSLDDGRRVRLSTDPTDRMIFGLSSGGIAAFTAAWNRPDMFSKVFSGCGTFVPMRGGEQLQVIVRKHEPKALRICLQDGFSDSWNPLFGSWFEANAMLGTALTFAGYDSKFDWQEGVHSVRRATEIFPEVMEWMWRDYPSEIHPGKTGNNYLSSLLIEGEGWETIHLDSLEVVDKIAYPVTVEENVTAFYPDGSHIAAADGKSNFLKQYRIDGDGIAVDGQRFYYLHSKDNSPIEIRSMCFDGDGYLWVLAPDEIQICDQNGRVRGILSIPETGPDSEIHISDGSVMISADGSVFRRKVNVKPPVKGTRPVSQGAA